MNFTGSFAGGCTVTGKLTPVNETAIPYMAEMTVTGSGCQTTFAAGTYDGYAVFTPAVNLGSICGFPIPSVPKLISFSFSPLRRGMRDQDLGNPATAAMKPLLVQKQ
jgi:hypothetical protein